MRKIAVKFKVATGTVQRIAKDMTQAPPSLARAQPVAEED
jgi:hypothetical protein